MLRRSCNVQYLVNKYQKKKEKNCRGTPDTDGSRIVGTGIDGNGLAPAVVGGPQWRAVICGAHNGATRSRNNGLGRSIRHTVIYSLDFKTYFSSLLLAQF